MRFYLEVVEAAKNPEGFDKEGWASDRYDEALNDVFLPYVKTGNLDEFLAGMKQLKMGLVTYPTLHMLAMIKRDNYNYTPELVLEFAKGPVGFLDHHWKDGNVLARHMTRLVIGLHDAGLSPIDPADFVLLMAESMEDHPMKRVALREMFVPMQWNDEAAEDPSTHFLGQALLKSPELQEKLLSNIKDNRFLPALKHYPAQALAVAFDRDSRQDASFGKDLGL